MGAMETYTSLVPLLVILVSLTAVPLIVAFGNRPNIREAWTLGAAVVKFLLVFSLLPAVLDGRVAEIVLMDISPNLQLALRADTLGLFFALLASGLWILTSLYSIGYVRGAQEKKQTRYFASFALALSATMGIAFAANLLTLVLFYEVLTLSTYPLVVHKETPEAIAGGRKYLLYTLSGGLALIVAVAWTHLIAGPVTFQAGGFLYGLVEGRDAVLLFMLFAIGAGVKSAIMPLHSWLPAAMVAPTPVSALLHAVAVVTAGVFTFVRIIGFVFGPTLLQDIGVWNWLAGLAALTFILASLLAFGHDNLKRRLAYSTIGHLSYIVMGTSLLTPAAMTGGILHIANHAVMKITLFFCAGAIYVKTHKENVSSLNGLGRRMPITFAAFGVAALGLAGIPPSSGFVSKWLLGIGSLQAGQGILLAALLISGLLNAGYLFPVVYRGFFLRPDGISAGEEAKWQVDEASYMMVVPLALTALLSLFLGLFPNGVFHFYDMAKAVAAAVLGAG